MSSQSFNIQQEDCTEFIHFLHCNLNEYRSDLRHKLFREGVFNISFLFQPADSIHNPVLKARFLYVRNICLNVPERFDVPQELSKYERALMFLSFDDILGALASLDMQFTCEVIGTTARTRTGAEVNVPVLMCTNTHSDTLCDYSADGYTYEAFKIQPLEFDELIYCYVKMMDILRNEDNETLKKFKLKAYLDRVLSEVNTTNILMSRAFHTIKAEVFQSTEDLMKIKDIEIPVTDDIFTYPITFKFDVMINLGMAYKARYFFKEAYECLLPYPLFIEKIDCLIGLRKSSEAVTEINSFISMIGDSQDREDRIILCDLNIKLAHLHQNPVYFDRAFQAFRCSKPHHLKGLFFFQKKEYPQAVVAFEDALKLSPKDEKIRFSYGCALVEVDRISDALKVFSELRTEDPMNEKVAKNLGYCYYKLDDVENTLTALKQVSLKDSGSMGQFFILSVKNHKVENVRWSLSKISTLELLKGGVPYILSNEILSQSEVIDLVKANPYVDSESFNEIFQGCA